jgi:DNA-3-methyladenine glycosylase II
VLHIDVSGARPGARLKADVTRALERLQGLRIDLAPFYTLAAADARLGILAARFRGLKPPRFPTVWEGVVNGIACQQLSLNVGILLLNRLAAAYGPAVDTGNATRHAFPGPEDLAGAQPEHLRTLGFSGAKGRALIELAREVGEKRLDLEALSNLESREAISRLLRVRGVGRWTAEYTLLRGMGRIDLFPGDDIGARNNLERWLRLRESLDYGRVARILAKWKPYGGLVYFHLLLDSLERAGYVTSGQGRAEARQS